MPKSFPKGFSKRVAEGFVDEDIPDDEAFTAEDAEWLASLSMQPTESTMDVANSTSSEEVEVSDLFPDSPVNIPKKIKRKKVPRVQLEDTRLFGQDSHSITAATILGDTELTASIPRNEEAVRMERAVTRELVAQDLRKWEPFTRHIRTSRRIQFPLPSKEDDSGTTLSALATAAAERVSAQTKSDIVQETAQKLNCVYSQRDLIEITKPIEEEEEEEDELSNIASSDEEELPTVDLQYIRHLKELMRRDVAHRKRQKKIKSKTFRRILRSEKNRLRDSRERAKQLLNPTKYAQRLQQKMDDARALERLTQKHKNTSAWVRRATQRTRFSTESREAVAAQNALHQQLMQQGSNTLLVEKDVESNKNQEEEGNSVKLLVDALVDGSVKVDEVLQIPYTELISMPFMKRQQQQEEEEVEEQQQEEEEEEEEDSNEEEMEGELKQLQEESAALQTRQQQRELTTQPSSGRRVFKTESSHSPLVQLTDMTDIQKQRIHSSKPVSFSSPLMTTMGDDDDKVMEFHTDQHFPSTKTTKERIGFDESQHPSYVTARAFAQDDILDTTAGTAEIIEDSFAQEKRQETDKALGKPTISSLPGWNEWGGEDSELNARHKARVERAEALRELQRRTLLSTRADSKMDHVLINHEELRLATVGDKREGVIRIIPKQYESAEAFTQALQRRPLGPEFNTARDFTRITAPRVMTEPGNIIEPVDVHQIPSEPEKKRQTFKRRREVEEDTAKALTEQLPERIGRQQRQQGRKRVQRH